MAFYTSSSGKLFRLLTHSNTNKTNFSVRLIYYRTGSGGVFIEKTIDVFGQAVIKYDTKKELKYVNRGGKWCPHFKRFYIDVKFTEPLTGISQSNESMVSIYKDAYKVKCINSAKKKDKILRNSYSKCEAKTFNRILW